ncbi:hypothetical protein AB9N12_19000 [Bacteroides sp. AN502(2024)]|uniref:TackOD1 domain-containing metal-binding protein n=1 Tax=Bacteroides sp. AN502(2024) TaxID=3160599 RepID=UPI003518D279
MVPYSIDTNKLGRRILTIKGYVDIDATKELRLEDFDMTFIDTPTLSYNVVRLLLARTSPLISKKCRLKPRFLTVFNRNDFSSLRPLIDGFAQSAVDDEVTLRAEDILRNINNLHLKHDYGVVNTENDFFIELCRYCLSRGVLNFTASTMITLQKGLSAVYSAYVDIHETVGCGNNPDDKNLRKMVAWFLDSGYIEPVKFVERIHLCPVCQSSVLLFSECCSKCQSSNIREEDMIHHFRCANISPESEYQYDGELRCPKCKHFLRHIGVDYDRPAKVYTCNECGATQMHSGMKVACAVCGHTTQPYALTPYDIKEYTFTQAGIQFFCAHDI